MIELNGQPFGTMVQRYGGDTLNTATYLSRVSSLEKIQVHYVTALGEDKLSQAMKSYWQQDDIQTNWVLSDAQHQPGLYLIQLDSQGERTFLYWRNQSAAHYMIQHPKFPNVIQQLKQVDMLYLSGISLAILPSEDRHKLIEYVQELASQGVEIAFDSNYRPNLWQSAEQARSIYEKLLPLVKVALVTFDDEQLLWGDQNEQETITRLHKIGIPTIVVKCGSQGALLSTQQNQQWVNTTPIENIVDTTSAGDAFNAGFLNGYLQGKSLDECCQQGNQLAGIVIQHRGAIIDKNATSHLQQPFN